MALPDSLNFDRIAHRYDETRGGEQRGEQIAPDLVRLLRDDRPVLEVGVGTGVIALALLALGQPVIGMDLSAQMLARARERIGVRLVRGDAMYLPFATGSVDQGLSVWVLHVVADPVIVMREVARCLRPGGRYLVVDGKARYDPSHPVDAAYREIEVGLGIEPRLGRAHEYARLAPEADFRVVDIVESGPHLFDGSIADVAQNIATRCHSWMWDVPDEEWERISAPVLARLRSHPDFGVRTQQEGYQEILVLARD